MIYCGHMDADIWFFRTICMCGMMHHYCEVCGAPVEFCDEWGEVVSGE